jgi:hypothetical protein
MQTSGIIRFDKLTALGVQILRELERAHPPGVGFTFGPAPDVVLVRWDPSADFHLIYHLADLLRTRDEDSQVCKSDELT